LLLGEPTAQPTPTYVPTIVPISGAPLANQAGTPVPTSSFGEQPTEEPGGTGRPPLWLTAFLAGICCLMILLIGIIVLGFVVRRGNRKEGNNVK